MIAVCISLAAISLGLVGFTITCGVWMRSDRRELSAITDNLDGQRKLVAEYKHKFDTEFASHGVTAKKLASEEHAHAAVVVQRDEALEKCRAYLARSLQGATKDEINEVLAGLFAPVLAVVPASQASRSDGDGPDSLLRPAFPVQPAPTT